MSSSSSTKPAPISSPVSAHDERALSADVDRLAHALMQQLAPGEWAVQASHDWRPNDYDWATCHGLSGKRAPWAVFVQYSFGGSSPRDGGGSFSVMILRDGAHALTAVHMEDTWRLHEGDEALFEALRRACAEVRGG